jgi:ribose 1,5-bisphosphokinase
VTTMTGRGTLVLVVGPSGAGKDTLISAARERLAGDARYVFVRRIVTRAENAFEDHDTVTAEQFATTVAAGGYALHWQAHGLSYGLSRSIDDQIARGLVVVCNASRGIVLAARERYRQVAVILVDARPEVRAARIAARGRDAAAGSRSDPARAETAAADCDVVIDNSADLATASAAFTRALIAIGNRP